VALGDGKFEPRLVKTGLQSETGDIEIVQGLLEGEHVDVSAQFMLDSESKLREAIQKMLNPEPVPSGEHNHADVTMEEDDMEDLFSDEETQEEDSLDDLFEDDESDKN
jgi:Cu(I)/Ag(I) efflux system membrane fusion protein/cobalt-zinc-cadmium efflux system membrane fusion protein